MLSQDVAAKPQAVPPGAMADTVDPQLPFELLELELSLEGFEGGEERFREAVREAADAARGELLFDLPAAGLVPDCRRIAVLRIPDEDADDDAHDHGAMRVVLAMLDEEGAEIRVQAPDEETEHLVRFADAFVDVLQLMPEQPEETAGPVARELESIG